MINGKAKRTVKFRFGLLLFCALSAAQAAFTVEPTILTLDASAGERTAYLEVSNTGGVPVAVELSLFDRVLDIDGDLDRKAEVPSKDFEIYPSEIILKPKERARVQLQYKNKQRATADKAYSLFSKEVLIPVGEEEAEDVNIVIPAIVSYYTIVALETGKEGKLAFVSSKAIDNDMVELIVENKGNGRVSVSGLAIKTSADVIKSFTGKKNAVMPGQRRRFTFKYFRPLTSKEVKFIYGASD